MCYNLLNTHTNTPTDFVVLISPLIDAARLVWGKATFGNDSKKKPQDTDKKKKKKACSPAEKTATKSIIWWKPTSVCRSSSCCCQTLRKGTAEVGAVRPESKRQIKLNRLIKHNYWLTVGFHFFDSLNKNFLIICTSGLKPVTSFFFFNQV